jgi:hypothetical protein
MTPFLPLKPVFMADSDSIEIIGVVGDFHQEGLQKEVRPGQCGGDCFRTGPLD